MYALYARQSVDKQDSISIESQIEFCKYELRGQEQDYQTYIDKGFSGKNTNRPAFENMMKDIKQGKIEKVVVYKLDRISRSIVDFSMMMEIFKKFNVDFISSTEKFDTSTPIGRAMLSICIVFAQLERETIQKRVTDTYYSRSKRGFYMGGRIPYGLAIEKTMIDGMKTSKYVPVEAECKQIQLMYELYAEPKNSLGDIIRFFKKNEIKNCRGSLWNTARISETLRNPVYVKADMDIYHFFKSQGANIINDMTDFMGTNGIYLYHNEGVDKKQSSLAGKTVVIAPHEGIVSSEQWLKCRVKCLNNKQSTKTCKPKNSWLAGKMKCGKCGYALTIKKANTKIQRYFVCSAVNSTKACEGIRTIYAGELEDFISQGIRNKLLEFPVLTNKKESSHGGLNENKMKLSQIEEDISNLLNKVSNANEILMKYINEKVEQLDIQRKILLDQLHTATNDTIEKNRDTITNFADKWEQLDFSDKQLIVDILIQVIYMEDDHIKIIWKY